MRALHAVARVALHVMDLRRAREVVVDAARLMPRFASADEARAAAFALDGHGTCLSRALAISARLEGSLVVIGVDPGREHALLSAHAWVEHEGVPLRATDPRGQEIVRL